MIGILNIGLGNVQSVYNAIYENGYDTIFINTPEELTSLTHLILPGVGNFSAVMSTLKTLNFVDAIQQFIAEGKPTLGICLGMQLLATSGREGGTTQGLGIIPATVEPIPTNAELRIPHVGWNEAAYSNHHPIFNQIKDQRDFYFVHSFHMNCEHNDDILATTQYGNPLVCAVAKNNVVGVQFHPEKSQKNGMQLLENFCEWDGQC